MLKTDYKNDVLDTSVNDNRKYEMTNNSDGTISLTDVTVYSQEGSLLGANDINATNEAVNNINVYVGEDKKLHFVNGEGADSVLPFSGLDDVLDLFGECIFYSERVGDKAVFLTNRSSTRTSSEPALIGLSTTNSGYLNNAIFAKSEAGLSVSEPKNNMGVWTSNVGTAITPKGHTIYWGYGNSGSQDTSFYTVINGKTTNYGMLKFECPLILGTTPNPLALWLADKLLFGE